MKPKTYYTKSSRINIAYQVFGTGLIDLVYIPGWVSNIDLMWSCPELVRFLEELGKITRVILFDKRGTGLSDRIVDISTLDERMDDIRAVMDAAGSKKAILFGHSEGGSVSALFAATYPNRTISLITFGIFAKRRKEANYPWAPSDVDRQRLYNMIDKSWGNGEMNLETLAPSKANDKVFMTWLADYFRSGASPSAALVLTKMNTQVNIIEILGSIKVPTLIMQRTDDIDVKIEEGRFIAERIIGAQFEEFEGSDHLFWIGNTGDILDRMKLFIMNCKPVKNNEKQLFTIVAARIRNSHIKKYSVQDVIGKYVAQNRGIVVSYDENTFTSIFGQPSKAVDFSLGLVGALKMEEMKVSIAIHINESTAEEMSNVNQEVNQFLERILQQVPLEQIVITQPVKYLLSSTRLSFKYCRNIIEGRHKESISIFTLKVRNSELSNEIGNKVDHKFLQQEPLLENVLQSIEDYLSDEYFTVEKLCKEIGIGERQLQRKLKELTNKSPNQLISSVRLYRAKELLMSREYNISEIANQTGFANLSYFSKCFKKEFGSTPSAMLQN